MLKRAKNPAVLHTDAVQGFLKIPFSAKSLGADMISLSGTKYTHRRASALCTSGVVLS